ncbi:hypothetical protein EAH75_08570 [Rhodanobacter glycinis]|uniref:Uncharacterized protein n=1 Tax=Rhodanobacter glycinis TaxID=582702 RepID=A0A502CH02_9GAMM|nr:hypothetical protein [Rhodanobacter glycinis]TPG11011.1 hypothetical protein EAH88_00140 [Rhodanobacter glycinis]TPG48500.1 hypothetical protein EAH75_08570 [Rhodanobacter glycinis]
MTTLPIELDPARHAFAERYRQRPFTEAEIAALPALQIAQSSEVGIQPSVEGVNPPAPADAGQTGICDNLPDRLRKMQTVTTSLETNP